MEIHAIDLDGHGFSGRNPYDEKLMRIDKLVSSITSLCICREGRR